MGHFLFDTHVHTAEASPCGRLPARQMVRLYRDAGYSGLVVTDHLHRDCPAFTAAGGWEASIDRYLLGYRRAREEGERLGLAVLWGVELTLLGTTPGDYLIYGLEEQFLRRHPRLYDLELAAFREAILPWATGPRPAAPSSSHDARREPRRRRGRSPAPTGLPPAAGDGAGILIYQAHPFRPGTQPADPRLLDGVEVYNGNVGHDSRNSLAAAFAGRHGLLPIAGSDAHLPADVGRAGLWLPWVPRTAAELVALLRDPASFRLHPAADPRRDGPSGRERLSEVGGG